MNKLSTFLYMCRYKKTAVCLHNVGNTNKYFVFTCNSEDEVEAPSPQQSAESPKAEAAAKSELTLKFNTDPKRIYRCKNLGYGLKDFVRMDSSG